MRNANAFCELCGTPCYASPLHKANKQGKYCSIACAHESKKKGTTLACDMCGKSFYRSLAELDSISGKYFCGHSCRATYNNHLRAGEKHPNWINGKGSYRIRAIREYGLKCFSGEKCPLKGIDLPRFLYEVDHINNDKKNSKIENLQVLCVWCHRQKTIDAMLAKNNPKHSVCDIGAESLKLLDGGLTPSLGT